MEGGRREEGKRGALGEVLERWNVVEEGDHIVRFERRFREWK